MLRDLHFKFVGFHGTDGRCHIRLAKSGKDKPLVIVCSQYKNYYGTSVTNALELISEKLFYEIANDRIEGVSFDFKLPLYESWHSDVNAFDRILAKVHPGKYGRRFKDTLLDVVKVFSNVVWIEHYPKDVGLLQDYPTASIVTLNDGGPHWQHVIRNSDYLRIGFEPKDLFVSGDEIDLEVVGALSEFKTFQASNASNKNSSNDEGGERSVSEYRQCRWIQSLLDLLPAKLHAEGAEIGGESSNAVDEKYVHRHILRILAFKMPLPDLFSADFPISKRLGIYERGREKECDFVIYKVEGKIPHSVLEVKRTSELNSSLRSGVCQDLAKLALCSKRIGCYSYMLICGDSKIISYELFPVFGQIPGDVSGVVELDVSALILSSEYKGYLSDAKIDVVYLKFQGFSECENSSVFIFELSHVKDGLGSQRAYEFLISAPGSSVES